MSEKTNITLPFISETEIANLSVSALSNRPNEHSGQYGRKGLTPEELKAAFSALPVAIARRLNELIPKILARFDETETAFIEADEALRTAIMSAVGELDEALRNEIMASVSKLESEKVDKLARPIRNSVTYLYGEDKDDNTVLVKSSIGGDPNSIVIRDSDGYFSVKPPALVSHPVNKSYFDNKTNNSLYTEVTELERRTKSLTYAASGNIYDTTTLSGSGTAVQVGNACPYGIITRLGGDVAEITVGRPYTLDGATAYGNGKCDVIDGEIIMRAGSAQYVQIPCKLPSGASVSVYANGENEQGEKVAKYYFVTASGAVCSGQPWISSTDGTTLTGESAYLRITKENASAALASDLVISEIRVTVFDPADVELSYIADELEIPKEVRSLNGYGAEGAYIDFSEQRFYNASGVSTDISEYLPLEGDVLSLLPSAIIKFTDASGNAVTAEYDLIYKNKL